jgi:hypothetical protein
MEHFKKLSELIHEKEKIDECITESKGIKVIREDSSTKFIGFSNISYNHLNSIERIIGSQKLDLITKQLAESIRIELQKEKEDKEKEISKYSIEFKNK